MTFTPIKEDLYFSKGDSKDQRLGEIAKNQSAENAQVHILGYPDDEGVGLNGGRKGAQGGPDHIRAFLYKMTPPLLEETSPTLFDHGNLGNLDSSLEEKHQSALEKVRQSLDSEKTVLTLGGGHDYGYPDTAAFVAWALEKNLRPAVINFDAHLDVRPTTKGFHSGTPFFRLLSQFKGKLDFFEVGIQDWCNSKDHYQWAIDHGAQMIFLNEVLSSPLGFKELMLREILGKLTPKQPIALSIDIDGFSSSQAPGASQVFPVGIDAGEFLSFLQTLLKTHRVPLMGIYEVSPPFDRDGQTGKLAALLAHQFVCQKESGR